jgi:hypothetical protein
MGEFDGVRRVARTELNPHSERHPRTDPADPDRKGNQHGGKPEEEPTDSVELHEEPSPGPTDPKPKPRKKTGPNGRGLDISA